MRREPLHIAAVKLAMLGMLVACAKPGASVAPQSSRPPDTAEQTYTPVSRVSETWGSLQYSNSRARLAAFEESMQLESVGVMPDTAGSDLAGAQVYRVKNAEDFFERNKGRSGFCSEPPRWLAVRRIPRDSPPSGDIWLAMLTLDDWSVYRPDVPGYCAGGLYSPAASEARRADAPVTTIPYPAKSTPLPSAQ
jgi:hypothetical protein